MNCSNDCNQGRSCSCMNQYDEQHTKFLRSDPFKHTEFHNEEESPSNTKSNNLISFIAVALLVVCIIGTIFKLT
jgi:hypothetical protein